jgi:hypothetical protein
MAIMAAILLLIAAMAAAGAGAQRLLASDGEIVVDQTGSGRAGNSITGGRTGIVTTGSSAQLSGNTVEGAWNRGVTIGGDATAVLRDNHACGNGQNLWVADAANPDIDDSNEICEDGLSE